MSGAWRPYPPLQTSEESAIPQRIVCAWCKPMKVIREGRLPASHAMCDDCQSLMNADIDKRYGVQP